MTITAAALEVTFGVSGLTPVQKAITGVDQQVEKLGKGFAERMDSMAAAATRAGGVLTAAVTVPLVALGKNIVMAASDLEEARSAVVTVFGDSASAIEAFAADSAANLGITEEAALSATGQLGALFKGMGLGNADMTEFSKGIVTAASDLGSFYNVDPGEAFTALRAGLVGETEGLRRMGIIINAAEVEQQALKMGLAATTAEITEQDKVLARYQLIMSQVDDESGNFLDTADGLANSLRQMQAELGNLAADFGEVLLPYVKQGVGLVRQLAAWFGKLSKPMKTLVVGVAAAAAAAGPLLLVFGGIAKAVALLAPALPLLTGPIGLIVAALGGLFLAYQTNFLGFADGVQGALGWLQDTFQGVSDAVQGTIQTFSDLTARGFSPVEAAARSFNGILRGLGLGALSGPLKNVIDFFREAFFVVQDLFSYFRIAARDGDHLNDFLIQLPAGIQPVVQLFGNLIGIVQRVIEGFGSGGLRGAVDALFGSFGGLRDSLGGVLGQMAQIGGDILGAIWQGLQDNAPRVWGWLTTTFVPEVARTLGSWWEGIDDEVAFAWTMFRVKMQAKWMFTVLPWLQTLPGQIGEAISAGFSTAKGIAETLGGWATEQLDKLIALWESPDAATLAKAEEAGRGLGTAIGEFLANGLVAIFTSGDAFKQPSAADYDAMGLFGAGGIVPGEELGKAMADGINMDDVANGFFKSFEDAFGQAMADKNVLQIAWDWLQEDLSKGPGGSNNQFTPGPIFDWFGEASGLAPKTASAAGLPSDLPQPDQTSSQAAGAQLAAQLQAQVMAAVRIVNTDPIFLNTLLGFSQGITLKISAGIATATDNWTAFASNIRTNVTGALATVQADESVVGQIKQFAHMIVTGITSQLGLAVDQWAVLETRIRTETVGALVAVQSSEEFTGQVKQFAHMIVTGITSQLGLARDQWDVLKTILQTEVKAAIDFAVADNAISDYATKIGTEIVVGATLGVQLGSTVLDEAVRTMSEGAIGTAETTLEAESPSQVFVRIGSTIPQGLAVGIEQGMPAVDAAIRGGLSEIDELQRLYGDAWQSLSPTYRRGGLGEDEELERLYGPNWQSLSPAYSDLGTDAGTAFGTSFTAAAQGALSVPTAFEAEINRLYGTSIGVSSGNSFVDAWNDLSDAQRAAQHMDVTPPPGFTWQKDDWTMMATGMGRDVGTAFGTSFTAAAVGTLSHAEQEILSWMQESAQFTTDQISRFQELAAQHDLFLRNGLLVDAGGNTYHNFVMTGSQYGEAAGQAFGTSFTQAAQGAMSPFEQEIDRWMRSDETDFTFAEIDQFRELARQTEVTYQDMFDWMRGETTDFTFEQIDQFEAAFGAGGLAAGTAFGTSFTQAAQGAMGSGGTVSSTALNDIIMGLVNFQGDNTPKPIVDVIWALRDMADSGTLSADAMRDLATELFMFQGDNTPAAIVAIGKELWALADTAGMAGRAVGTSFNEGMLSTMPTLTAPSGGLTAAPTTTYASAGPGGAYASSGGSEAIIAASPSGIGRSGDSTPFNPVDDGGMLRESRQAAQTNQRASERMDRSTEKFERFVDRLLGGDINLVLQLDGQEISARVQRDIRQGLRKGFENAR